MTYTLEEAVRIASAYHSYLDSLLTLACGFNSQQYGRERKEIYLSSEAYTNLTSNYERTVPLEVRERFKPEVQSLLGRIFDSKIADSEIRFERIPGSDIIGPDDGND